ncbi:MAG: AzlD family protein [Chloroflexota bacterium]
MVNETLLAILGMALVTYGTRVGGYWLARRLPEHGRVRAGLNALPGAVLVSLLIPSLASGGVAEFAAAAATVGVMAISRSMLAAMLVGVGLVYILRSIGLG